MRQVSQWLFSMNFGRIHQIGNFRCLTIIEHSNPTSQTHMFISCSYGLLGPYVFLQIKFSLCCVFLKLKVLLERNTVEDELESQFRAGSSSSWERKMCENLGFFPSLPPCLESWPPPILWLISVNDRQCEVLESSWSQLTGSEPCPLGTSVFFLTLGSFTLVSSTTFSGHRFYDKGLEPVGELLLQSLPREVCEPSPKALYLNFLQSCRLICCWTKTLSLFNQDVFFSGTLQAQLSWSEEPASDLAWFLFLFPSLSMVSPSFVMFSFPSLLGSLDLTIASSYCLQFLLYQTFKN